MDRSYPYSRRLARRTQLQKRLAGVAALGVAGCAILYGLGSPAPVTAPVAAPAAPLRALASAGTAPAEMPKPGQRRVYPYSIVPGGVADAKELGRVIREDKVVAAHYAEFDLSRAHEKTVTAPRAVHVSYRKGDKVYWTAKKVMLAEGETLLSDGTHEARARCANQISDTPRLPVEAHGPSAEELDSSVVESDAALADGFENVSMGMPAEEDAGVRGGFLHAAGSGSAGGAMAGGGALGTDSGSLFAAAGTAGAPSGAFLSSRSGSSRAAPGKRDEDSAGGSGSGSGSGNGGGSPGGAPSTSAPATGTPAGGESSGTPGPTPQPGTAQPGTPGTPGTPAGGDGPATPSQPGGSSPATPGTPGGGQSGGGGATPSLPPSDIGSDPEGTPLEPAKPETGPGTSPVPPPTLNPPQEPAPPGQQPSQPAEIPEPGSAWLVGPLLALLLLMRRPRRRG